jgi:hypothetical protein
MRHAATLVGDRRGALSQKEHRPELVPLSPLVTALGAVRHRPSAHGRLSRVEVAADRSNLDIVRMSKKRFPYETSRWLAEQPDRGKNWYDDLEAIGPQNVRARLAQTNSGSRGEISIGASGMTIGFAQEWLAWHDAERTADEKARHERQIFWTRLAAISATVAGASAAIGWCWTIFHR